MDLQAISAFKAFEYDLFTCWFVVYIVSGLEGTWPEAKLERRVRNPLEDKFRKKKRVGGPGNPLDDKISL